MSHTLDFMRNFGPFYSSLLEPSHWTMASSFSSVRGFPINKTLLHLSQGKNTGISYSSVPGRLWCLEVTICKSSTCSSTRPMISFTLGDCECLAKTRYNSSRRDLCVDSLFWTLQWAGHWFIQRFAAQISEQWFPNLVCPDAGILQTLEPYAGAGSWCFAESWASADVGGQQPHIPLEWEGYLVWKGQLLLVVDTPFDTSIVHTMPWDLFQYTFEII